MRFLAPHMRTGRFNCKVKIVIYVMTRPFTVVYVFRYVFLALISFMYLVFWLSDKDYLLFPFLCSRQITESLLKFMLIQALQQCLFIS